MVDRLAKALVEYALELHRRRPWTRVPGDSLLLIRVPVEEAPLTASIMGQARSEYGLLLTRGSGAFAHFARMILEGRSSDGAADEWDMLSATFQSFASIPDEFRGLLREAGLSVRREQVAPLLMVKRPGRQLRPPNRGEIRLLAWCLQTLLAADDAGDLRPVSLNERRRRVLELHATGELRAPKVGARLVPWPTALELLPPVVDLGPGLAGLPRRAESWFATLVSAPGTVKDDDRTLRVFVLASADEQCMLAHEVVLGEDLQPAARTLVRVLRGEEPGVPLGLPESITFGHEALHDACAPALSALGVHTEIGAAPPFLEGFEEWLREAAAAKLDKGTEGRLPESLAEWKDADRSLTVLLLRDLESAVTPRALSRYFGSEDDAEEILEELEPLSPLGAFLEWLLCDYRATRASKTQVERRLAQKRLTPVERTLLEARRDATLSIYRVDAAEPGATLEVEDIFSGERRTVHDSSLSGCGLEGFFIPLRLTRVAEWTFPVLAGPPLDTFDVERAVAELTAALDTTAPEDLRRSAHLFGRLWMLHLEHTRHPPRLQNTDGDSLEPVTAVFRVADGARLREHLAARPDLEADPDGSWIWLRPGPPARGIGENTILGQLETHDDRLVLEVNSTPRFERARRWLEAIPGVRFESAERHALDRHDRPQDDRLPGREAPLDPEMKQEIERHTLELYRRWLDEPLPALGSLTPRACCRTSEGRRRVAQLVRTLAPVMIPGGSIPPPRELLLRELGIEP